MSHREALAPWLAAMIALAATATNAASASPAASVSPKASASPPAPASSTPPTAPASFACLEDPRYAAFLARAFAAVPRREEDLTSIRLMLRGRRAIDVAAALRADPDALQAHATLKATGLAHLRAYEVTLGVGSELAEAVKELDGVVAAEVDAIRLLAREIRSPAFVARAKAAQDALATFRANHPELGTLWRDRGPEAEALWQAVPYPEQALVIDAPETLAQGLSPEAANFFSSLSDPIVNETSYIWEPRMSWLGRALRYGLEVEGCTGPGAPAQALLAELLGQRLGVDYPALLAGRSLADIARLSQRLARVVHEERAISCWRSLPPPETRWDSSTRTLTVIGARRPASCFHHWIGRHLTRTGGESSDSRTFEPAVLKREVDRLLGL